MNRLYATCDKAPLIKVTRKRLTQFIMNVCRQRLAQLSTNGRDWHIWRRTEECCTV